MALWCVGPRRWRLTHAGYYVPGGNCRRLDFVDSLFLPVAWSSLSLFVLGQKRIVTMAGIIYYIACVAALIVPTRSSSSRIIVDMLVYGILICFVSFWHELNRRSSCA